MESRNRKLIDNLEKLAEDLVKFAAENVPELKEAIKSAKAKYQDTYWGLGWFYAIFRTRALSADHLNADIEEAGDSQTMMPALDRFLSQGAVKTTSINTQLLYDLLNRFLQEKKQEYVDEDARDGMSHETLQRFHEIFLQQIEKLLESKTPESIISTLQTQRTEELETLSRNSKSVDVTGNDEEAKQAAGVVMRNVLEELMQKKMGKTVQGPAERRIQDKVDREKAKDMAVVGDSFNVIKRKLELHIGTKARHVQEKMAADDKFAASQNTSKLGKRVILDRHGQEVDLAKLILQVRDTKAAATDDTAVERKALEQEPGKLDMKKFMHLNSLFAQPKTVQQAQEEKRREQDLELGTSRSSFNN